MAAADPRPAGERGHAFDGIVELDHRLPLWWQLTLYGAVVFALIYWFGTRLGSIATPDRRYADAMAMQRAAEAQEALARGAIDDRLLRSLSLDPVTVNQGRETFVVSCAPCHRADGGGNIGPNLTDSYWIHGGRPTDIFRTIGQGVPLKGMPTWEPQLGQERVLKVAAFVVSIKDTNIAGGKAPQGVLAAK